MANSVPDNFVPSSKAGEHILRQMLEEDAIENYRREKMSLGRVAELLDLSIDETHAFLKELKVPLNYDTEDLARDRRTIEKFLKNDSRVG